MMQNRRTFWKPVALPLAALLAWSWAGPIAEAAKPKRLSAALSALQSCKKQLADAKDPPATFHQKSLSAVDQAIAAVEREIKAYEDGAGKKDREKDRDSEVPERGAKGKSGASADRSHKHASATAD
jgi:hypothetical protein